MELSLLKTKKNIISFLAAFGITLTIPWVMHYMGLALNIQDPTLLGKVFLPMHLGVFIGAMMFGPIQGALIGSFAPIVSFMVTGMPIIAPFPMVQLMTVELAVYGLITGLVYKKTKKEYLSLISGIISGRIAILLVLSFGLIAIKNPNFSTLMFIKNGLLNGLVGIAIQLTFIPILIKKMKKK
ncbi:MAG: hypothetical protein B6I28_06005 [Fusobacteriia bacterium 4572_132]|nr:MAG: hypothetical protein B6I28_06005 [Fusobacteriia bacterium 4572_132]